MTTHSNYPGAGPQVFVDVEQDIISRAFPVGAEADVATFLTQLEQTYSRRRDVAAKLLDKLNEERPHDPEALRRAGLGWKANFTTRPLNTLVGRVIGRLTGAVEKSRFLTTTQLPPEVPNYRRKSEFFQRAVTDFVREDPRWSDLINDLALQTALFGSDAALWLSEDEWLPESGGQDVMLPAGTRTVAQEAQQIVVKVRHAPKEAFDMLVGAMSVSAPAQVDPETGAEIAPATAGDPRWNVERMIGAINRAMPTTQAQQREGVGVGEAGLMMSEMRRSLMSYSTASATKVVTLYHIFAREMTGQVTYLIYDDEKKEVFRHEDAVESMEHMAAFFSFERPASKAISASKGVGRIAYAMASVLDRARCDTVDRLQMAGKVLIQGPEANLSRFRMHVIGGAMVFGSDWTPVEQVKIEANVDEAIALDNYLRALLDDMTGSVSPKVVGGERVTAAQINLLAGREDERSDEIITRFLSHVGRMMTQIQRRLLDPRVADKHPRVAEFQRRIQTMLTPEEIEIVKSKPAVSTVMGLTEQERQAIVAACVEGRTNPVYDQYAIEREKLAAQISPDFADRVLLPANDPTVIAEQTRMQMFESDLLLNGQEVPVSPRDNHEIHLQGLIPVLQSLGGSLAAPDGAGLLAVVLAHADQHAQAIVASGQPVSPELQEVLSVIEQTKAALQTLPPEETPAPVEGGVAPVAEESVAPAAPAPDMVPAA